MINLELKHREIKKLIDSYSKILAAVKAKDVSTKY